MDFSDENKASYALAREIGERIWKQYDTFMESFSSNKDNFIGPEWLKH